MVRNCISRKGQNNPYPQAHIQEVCSLTACASTIVSLSKACNATACIFSRQACGYLPECLSFTLMKDLRPADTTDHETFVFTAIYDYLWAAA